MATTRQARKGRFSEGPCLKATRQGVMEQDLSIPLWFRMVTDRDTSPTHRCVDQVTENFKIWSFPHTLLLLNSGLSSSCGQRLQGSYRGMTLCCHQAKQMALPVQITSVFIYFSIYVLIDC